MLSQHLKDAAHLDALCVSQRHHNRDAAREQPIEPPSPVSDGKINSARHKTLSSHRERHEFGHVLAVHFSGFSECALNALVRPAPPSCTW
jgi:hypothetical protein